MKWWNKVIDFPTGNNRSYQKEMAAYDAVLDEMDTIEDLLECLVSEDALEEYPDLYQKREIRLKATKDAISMYQKGVARASGEAERNRLRKEIEKLKKSYKKMYDDLKDELLLSGSITELNECLSKMESIIYKHANLEAFQDFLDQEEWEMADLENLRNSIGIRKAEIIPYLGRMK